MIDIVLIKISLKMKEIYQEKSLKSQKNGDGRTNSLQSVEGMS